MFRTILLTLFLAAGGACAKQPPVDAGLVRSEEQPLRLPEDLLGVWTPLSENYVRYGKLTISRDVLTWGSCTKAPFRTLRSERKAFLIQVSNSSSCTSIRGADLFVLKPYDNPYVDKYTKDFRKNLMHIEVSICQERPEQLDQPHEHIGRCSTSGVLYKSRP
jgi:hypothetical protein